MLSIITVCYNSEATIARTIRSVLCQTDRRYEHVFVDGASTDNTLSIIARYQSEYEQKGVRCIVVSEKDDGFYDAMNKGIALASGDRIGILNSDDAYRCNTVRVIHTFDERYGADCQETPDIIMGTICIHNGSKRFVKRAKKDGIYITSRHFNHPAMFVKKECYQRVGGYAVGNVHNDFRWYLKARNKGVSVGITPMILADFYTGGASSPQALKDVAKRIGTKYEVYRKEGYSPLYLIECIGMECAKYLIIEKESRSLSS